MPTTTELKEKAKSLRKLLRQVESMPGVGNVGERQSNQERKREQRQASKEVVIPPCEDRDRRELLESDVFEWLEFYFADIFTYAFTPQQREMILAIQNALKNGDDQALAASRGEGKTTLAECVLIYCVLTGVASFAVLFSATGADAEHSLEAIKERLADNDRLAADYPEVCTPIRALENTPNRAHYQVVTGKRHDDGREYRGVASKFSWCGREITLPRVPGSTASRAIIATRGLDSAVRGLKIGNRRPDFALIDDPDTIDTANSEEQAAKLEGKIDKAIAGLGGQKRRIARVMLTTLQNRICVSYKFTDPTQKQSWRGKRFKFLLKPPTRSDMWDEYVQLQHADWQNETTTAHEFYVANREAMDEGAEVANPNRYANGELSALQHYYTQVARIGPEAVATEYDNDPPEETGPIESGITAHRIQKQLSGYPRKMVPPGCTLLTQGIDVRKVALHWVVRAWRPDGSGFTIDYGVHEVHGTTYGSEEGLDVAVKRAILDRLEVARETAYVTAEGSRLPIDLTLVDAGWRTNAVYSACQQIGLGIYPVMGFGKSSGCTQANFSEVQRKTIDRKPGDGWFLSRKGHLWLVCADTDRWKAWEHDRWMTSPEKPGAMALFGEPHQRRDRLSDDEKSHHSYARHITNEVEVEEPYKGTLRRRWKSKSENTHWLDASYYADVAANMKGIKLIGASVAKAARPTGERPTLAAMAARK